MKENRPPADQERRKIMHKTSLSEATKPARSCLAYGRTMAQCFQAGEYWVLYLLQCYTFGCHQMIKNNFWFFPLPWMRWPCLKLSPLKAPWHENQQDGMKISDSPCKSSSYLCPERTHTERGGHRKTRDPFIVLTSKKLFDEWSQLRKRKRSCFRMDDTVGLSTNWGLFLEHLHV